MLVEEFDRQMPRIRYRAGDKEYVRYGKSDWRYADDEEIQVPGGRDMRLSERFEPIIGSKGGERKVVIIEGEDVLAAPEVLGWTLSVGNPVRSEDGHLLKVLVPYVAWEEHDEISDVMVAPELDEDDGVRNLAAVELELKKTERQLAEKVVERDKLLIELAVTGMTRQRAAEITGMSVGKVQQIIKSEELAANEQVLVGILAEHGSVELSRLADYAKAANGLASSKTKLRRFLNSLKKRGLVGTDPHGHWRLTPKGEQAFEKVQEGEDIPPADNAGGEAASKTLATVEEPEAERGGADEAPSVDP